MLDEAVVPKINVTMRTGTDERGVSRVSQLYSEGANIRKTDINTFLFTLTLGMSVFFFVVFCLFNCYRAKRGDKIKVAHAKKKHRHKKVAQRRDEPQTPAKTPVSGILLDMAQIKSVTHHDHHSDGHSKQEDSESCAESSCSFESDSHDEEVEPGFGWVRELHNITYDQILNTHGEEILIYLLQLKYSFLLFFLMSIANIPVILTYLTAYFKRPADSSLKVMDSLTILTILKIDTHGIKVNADDENVIFVVLLTFIIHMLLQHMMLLLFDIECDYWSSRDLDMSGHKLDAHIRQNSLVIYNLNKDDDPKQIENFFNQHLK